VSLSNQGCVPEVCEDVEPVYQGDGLKKIEDERIDNLRKYHCAVDNAAARFNYFETDQKKVNMLFQNMEVMLLKQYGELCRLSPNQVSEDLYDSVVVRMNIRSNINKKLLDLHPEIEADSIVHGAKLKYETPYWWVVYLYLVVFLVLETYLFYRYPSDTNIAFFFFFRAPLAL